MLKKLLVTTAISGLMLSSAMAQTSPGAMNPDASKSPSSMSNSDASKAPMNSSATISTQSPDQLLASNVKGADVLGSDNQKIGDISDILFSKDGKVEAYLLSVGGFLGVGAKEVALSPSSVQLMQDNNTWKAKVTMTKDQLAQAPNFERHKDRATTTTGSSTSGMSGAPRNSTMTPNAPAPTPPTRQ